MCHLTLLNSLSSRWQRLDANSLPYNAQPWQQDVSQGIVGRRMVEGEIGRMKQNKTGAILVFPDLSVSPDYVKIGNVGGKDR